MRVRERAGANGLTRCVSSGLVGERLPQQPHCRGRCPRGWPRRARHPWPGRCPPPPNPGLAPASAAHEADCLTDRQRSRGRSSPRMQASATDGGTRLGGPAAPRVRISTLPPWAWPRWLSSPPRTTWPGSSIPAASGSSSWRRGRFGPWRRGRSPASAPLRTPGRAAPRPAARYRHLHQDPRLRGCAEPSFWMCDRTAARDERPPEGHLRGHLG